MTEVMNLTNMSRHVSTNTLRHRPDEPSIAEQKRKLYVFILLCCWQNISERNLKQQIKVCEKIGNSANEMLANNTYTEHAWKESSGFEWHSQHEEIRVI